jgi:hypothetical protein
MLSIREGNKCMNGLVCLRTHEAFVKGLPTQQASLVCQCASCIHALILQAGNPAASSNTMSAQPAGVTPAAQQQAPARAVVQQPMHKSTAIIPGWSKVLSSSSLGIECQKIHQPNRNASTKDCFGVMELEVMKFVAYCGGLTIRMRVDDMQFGASERCAHFGADMLV